MTPPLLAALDALLEASHLSAPEHLPAMTAHAGRLLGADHALLFLVDYEQSLLVPFAESEGSAEAVSIDGTLAGRSYIDVTPHVTDSGALKTVWTPLLDGTERLGVLQLQFPQTTEVDDDLLTACQRMTALLAELVMTRTVYGDVIERLRRRKGLTVPAEIQWRLLPPLTFVTRTVGIAGVLQPAEEIAGDSFDYALNGDIAHIAIFDAIGHGLEATLLVAVAVSTLRNARRQRMTMPETIEAIDATLAGEFGPDKFVTGIVAELDVSTGWWRWITCGHPPALLVRGGRVVKTLDSVLAPPLGLGMLDTELSIGQERLERGDRLLLYSDGVTEARAPGGEFFGTERLVEFVTREAAAGHPVAESLRRLNRAILEHQEGHLQDDATTVVVEWYTDEAERSTPPV
ncbi:MAG: PP2C family protein-serine/threonine phosphatase [Actinomycetes bacterium]